MAGNPNEVNLENMNMGFYQSEKSTLNSSVTQHKLSQLEKILDDDFQSKSLKIMTSSFNFLWFISFILAISNYFLIRSFIGEMGSSLDLLQLSKDRIETVSSIVQYGELLLAMKDEGYYLETEKMGYYYNTEDFLRTELEYNLDRLVETNYEFTHDVYILGENLAQTILMKTSDFEDSQDRLVKLFVLSGYELLDLDKNQIEEEDLLVIENGLNELLASMFAEEKIINSNLSSFRKSNLLIYYLTLVFTAAYTVLIVLAFPPIYLRIKKEELQALMLFEHLSNSEIENQKGTLDFLLGKIEELQHSSKKPLEYYSDIIRDLENFRVAFQTSGSNRKISSLKKIKQSSTKGMYKWFWFYFFGVLFVAMISLVQISYCYYYISICVDKNTRLLTQVNYSYYLMGYQNTAASFLSVYLMHNGTSMMFQKDPETAMVEIFDNFSTYLNTWTDFYLNNKDLETYEHFENIISTNLCEEIYRDPPENYPCNHWMDYSAKQGLLPLLSTLLASGNTFYKSFISTARTERDIRDYLSSKDFSRYTFMSQKISQDSIESEYDFTKVKFEEQMKKEINIFLVITLVYCFFFALGLWLIWLQVYKAIEREIVHLKNIIGIIPVKVIFENKFIQNQLSRISQDFIDKI